MSNIIRISDLQYEKKSSVSLMLLQRWLPTADRADSSSGSCYSGWSYLQAYPIRCKDESALYLVATCSYAKMVWRQLAWWGDFLLAYRATCMRAEASMICGSSWFRWATGNGRPRIAHTYVRKQKNAILVVRRVKQFKFWLKLYKKY